MQASRNRAGAPCPEFTRDGRFPHCCVCHRGPITIWSPLSMVRLGAVDKWIAAGEGAGMAWRAMKGMTLTVGKDRSSFMAAPDARAGVVDVTPPAPPRRIRMLGMPISVVTEPQAVAHGIACLGPGHRGWGITANLDELRL